MPSSGDVNRYPAIPFAIACLGIALFTCMDTVMKRLSIELGAYAAILWRQGLAAVIAGALYLPGRQAWPGRMALRFHVMRGCVGAFMAISWFYGLARLPMAEAVALSFIAPIIALYLAALLLSETVPRSSVIASMLGAAGVAVMLAARVGLGGERHMDGVAAILFSSVLYAWNLILMRQQALVARPIEVAFFQNLISGGWLLTAAPVLLIWWPDLLPLPGGVQWPLDSAWCGTNRRIALPAQLGLCPCGSQRFGAGRIYGFLVAGAVGRAVLW